MTDKTKSKVKQNKENMQSVTNNIELERLKSDLLKIAPSITSEEKMKAALKMTVSERTVSRYLKGEVARIAMGKKLLEFFSKLMIEKGVVQA